MTSRSPLPLAFLVLTATLAGCAGGNGGDADPTSSDTQTSTAPSLTAIIKILAGGNVTLPVNGSVPAEAGVALTFDASDSTGAIVTYAWDFGDNATGSNEVETHAYTGGGSYNVTLTVTGLGNASATASTVIAVADDPAGTFLFTEAHTFTGSLPLANPNSCTTQDVDCRDHVVTIRAADDNGTAAIANRTTIIVDGSGTTAIDMQVFWRSPDGTNLAQSPASGLDHTVIHEGDMAPGDYVVRVRLFVGAQATYTIAVAVDYVHA